MASADNQILASRCADTLRTIDLKVPETTVDYRVEEARRALQALMRAADSGDIITRDRRVARELNGFYRR